MNPDFASLPIRDIHLPASVSWWPLAPGWWITLGLFVLAALVVYFLKFMKERRQLEQQVVEEFEGLVNEYRKTKDAYDLLASLSRLIRRVGITRFGHRRVAALTGTHWLNFLDEVLAATKSQSQLRFEGELGELLIAGQYQKSGPIDENSLDRLLIVSKAWLLTACKQPRKPGIEDGDELLRGEP